MIHALQPTHQQSTQQALYPSTMVATVPVPRSSKSKHSAAAAMDTVVPSQKKASKGSYRRADFPVEKGTEGRDDAHEYYSRSSDHHYDRAPSLPL